MARVQVQDLPGAPGLQPTVRSGGQYGVAVQQAGRNKLMDLADALSTVNPMLKDYAAIADLDAQQYEDELSRLSPEEIQKKLSQSEEALDKEVRKGNIPFLGSPLSWKRKKRALGKASQKNFYNQLIAADGRLRNPIEGDADKNTAEIINEEVQKFVESNPALQGTFVKEGFQEALNPSVTALTAQFDGEKARVAQAEILLENTSDIYTLAKDASMGSAQYEEDMKGALADWGELNSFNTAQQIKVIENVAEQLAKVDERKAYEFLKWAGKNLKVGNTTFGKMEDQFDRIDDMIERQAEVQGRLDKAEREDKVEAISSQYTLDVNAIQNSGSAEYNGETYTDVSSLLKAYQNDVAEDGDTIYAAEAQTKFESVTKGDVNVDEYASNQIMTRSTLGRPGEAFRLLQKDLDNASAGAFDVASKFNYVQSDPRYRALLLEINNEFNAARDRHLKDLVSQGKAQNPSAAANELDELLNADYASITSKAELRLDKLTTKIEKERDSIDRQQAVLSSSNEKSPEIETGYFGDGREEIVTKIGQANGVIANPIANIDERKKAIQLLASPEAKEVAGELADIAMGRKNKKESYTLPTVFSIFGDAAHYKTAPVPFTPGEKKKALDQLVNIYAFSGDFADTKVLKGGKLPEFSFDVKELDSRVIVFITPEEASEIRNIEDVSKLPKDIVERAKLVGRGDDVTAFINDQVKLLTRLGRLSN